MGSYDRNRLVSTVIFIFEQKISEIGLGRLLVFQAIGHTRGQFDQFLIQNKIRLK